MKKMKLTLAAAVTLAACVSTQVYAQVKQDIITFALAGQQQTSVSTTTGNNVGNFSAQPHYYKTGGIKVTDQDVIHYIGFVKHGNANYYGKAAHLVLVQGELSGFFNVTPDLGHSQVDDSSGYLDGDFSSDDSDANTSLANSLDSTYVTMSDGRHITNNPVNGLLVPPGHMQPWGQIYVQFTDSVGDLTCENVTYYFALQVEECYDCFYLNSFISDAVFTTKAGSQAGPPCCSVGSTLIGKGRDRYYLTLSFDNTANNPYLNPDSLNWAGDYGFGVLSASTIPGDGIIPDAIPYSDPILSHIGHNEPYVARFTLNGILTYTWTLNFLNKTDIAPDFLGTGSYVANGYGFIGLYCNLFTGTATFAERLVKAGSCCTGEIWSDGSATIYTTGWYGIGAEYLDTADTISGFETLYDAGLYPTPLNVSTSLTYHENFNRGGYETKNATDATFPAAWPSPAVLQNVWETVVTPY